MAVLKHHPAPVSAYLCDQGQGLGRLSLAQRDRVWDLLLLPCQPRDALHGIVARREEQEEWSARPTSLVVDLPEIRDRWPDKLRPKSLLDVAPDGLGHLLWPEDSP